MRVEWYLEGRRAKKGAIAMERSVIMFDSIEPMEVRYDMIRRRSSKSGEVRHLEFQSAWMMSDATIGN